MLKQNPAIVKNEPSRTISDSLNQIKDWITVLVSVEKPPAEVLYKLDRSERHQLLCRNAQKRYEDIVDWIDEKGITSEFKRIGSPTLFSTITMVCTLQGAQLLSHAPGVQKIVGAPEFALNGH